MKKEISFGIIGFLFSAYDVIACGPDGPCGNQNCPIRQQQQVQVLQQAPATLPTRIKLHWSKTVVEQLEKILFSYGVGADEFRMGVTYLDTGFARVTDQDIEYIVQRFPNINYLDIDSTVITLKGIYIAFHLNKLWRFRSNLTFGIIKKEEYLQALHQWTSQGCLPAAVLLAAYYDRGIYLPKDSGKATEIYVKAAQAGSPVAQYQLGLRFKYGIDVPQSPDQALGLFKASAAQGNPQGLFELAEALQNDRRSGPEEIKMSLQFYKEAGVKGHIDAVQKMADFFEMEHYDSQVARNWNLAAAKMGSVEAMLRVAEEILDSNDAETQFGTYIKWLELAASRGSPEAQTKLGMIYLDGRNSNQFPIAQDSQKAIGYFESAAKQFHLIAMNKLGQMYFNGIYFERNYVKAGWYFKNVLYLSSKGMEEDLDFLDWDFENPVDKRSVSDGEDVAASESAFALAEMYAKGLSVHTSSKRAVQLLEYAGDLGHKEAMFKVAMMHLEGNGTPVNIEKSVELLRGSMRFGDERASRVLYEVYARSLEANPAFIAQFPLLIAGLRQGVPDAQAFLGKMYLYGNVVPKDEEKGIFFVSMAIRNGSQAAAQVMSEYNQARQAMLGSFPHQVSVPVGNSNP